MAPYFRDEDIPEPFCEGSYHDLKWEGKWDDPTRPKEIACPVCGVNLKPDCEEYETDEKKGGFFACIPAHYPGEVP